MHEKAINLLIWNYNFKCGFCTKVTCKYLLQKNIMELSELNTLKQWKNDDILHINYQRRVSRVYRTFPFFLDGSLDWNYVNSLFKKIYLNIVFKGIEFFSTNSGILIPKALQLNFEDLGYFNKYIFINSV